MNVSISAKISRDEERTTAHDKIMKEIAAEIVSPAPRWLVEVLSNCSFDIRSARSIEEMWPKRQKMRDELQEIRGLADLLDVRLQNLATTRFITAHSDSGSLDVISDLGRDIRELRSQLGWALNSPILVDGNGKVRRGRGKPLLPDLVSPKGLCAALVAEIFDFFNADEASKPPQRKVLSAANKLWRAWVAPKGWGADPLNGWKDHFEEIDDPILKPFRAEVRRVLSILANFQAQLEKK